MMKGALTVKSRYARVRMSAAVKKMLWDSFLKVGHTNHSARAMTLAYLINRCEEERVCYVLTAHPTLGYQLQRVTGFER